MANLQAAVLQADFRVQVSGENAIGDEVSRWSILGCSQTLLVWAGTHPTVSVDRSLGRHTGCPADVSAKQKRHGGHDSAMVTTRRFGQPRTTCLYSLGATIGTHDE